MKVTRDMVENEINKLGLDIFFKCTRSRFKYHKKAS